MEEAKSGEVLLKQEEEEDKVHLVFFGRQTDVFEEVLSYSFEELKRKAYMNAFEMRDSCAKKPH